MPLDMACSKGGEEMTAAKKRLTQRSLRTRGDRREKRDALCRTEIELRFWLLTAWFLFSFVAELSIAAAHFPSLRTASAPAGRAGLEDPWHGRSECGWCRRFCPRSRSCSACFLRAGAGHSVRCVR